MTQHSCPPVVTTYIAIKAGYLPWESNRGFIASLYTSTIKVIPITRTHNNGLRPLLVSIGTSPDPTAGIEPTIYRTGTRQANRSRTYQANIFYGDNRQELHLLRSC